MKKACKSSIVMRKKFILSVPMLFPFFHVLLKNCARHRVETTEFVTEVAEQVDTGFKGLRENSAQPDTYWVALYHFRSRVTSLSRSGAKESDWVLIPGGHLKPLCSGGSIR